MPKIISSIAYVPNHSFIGSGAVTNNLITIKKNSFIKAGSIAK